MKKKIAVLIPCYNEEDSIGAVISSFPVEQIRSQGYELEIVVIDNNSCDNTGDIARSLGVKVIHEPKQGKGNAIRAGFYSLSHDVDYVVMLDGDKTYRSEEILRLIEPIDSGFCNVVTGSRLGGRIADGSMTTFNRMGNWIFSHLVRIFFRVPVTDVLTGYFAWTRETIERLRPHLVSNGFAIEMEMITKMAKLGEEIYSVPISYDARSGHTNLRPIYDGLRILWMLAKNFFWMPQAPAVQRIAFVSDSVMPYFNGGKEKRLYEISRRLVSTGREVHIYTMKWWKGGKIIQHDGVYFHAISRLYPLYTNGRRSMSQAVLFGFATFKLLFKKFDVLDVDHMPYFPLMSARIVAWLKRKRLYATWHEVWGREYWMEYIKGPVGFFGYILERLTFLLPDVIISNCKHTTLQLRESGVKQEIRTIPLGVDLPNVYAAPPAPEMHDIIFVGRLLSHKNADLLVETVRIIKNTNPKISCRIIGDGPEKENIRKLIQELGLEDNIKMLDSPASHSDLYGLMKASKMLVLPSIREGFGIVAVEAFAAGIPVITTSHKNNAAKDLILEGINGFLAEPTAAALAEKIEQVLACGGTLDPRREIEQYDWGIVAGRVGQALATVRI